ncbi:MAG: DJ-1 family glyoxalase III [Planctomycetota bacterium]
MAKACVLLAEGFEEIEAVTIVDVLRRAGAEVVALAVEGRSPDSLAVTGSHGIRVVADAALAERSEEAWDAVILPGGMPGSTNLRDSPAVQALVKKQHARGGKLAAICAAPIALAAAGVLDGKKATSYPGLETQLRGATYLTNPIVRDGQIVTSRGPGTALAFALELASELQGRQVADGLRAAMLVAP